MMTDSIRALRYRLKRQGMLELDVWLSKLDAVLESDSVKEFEAIKLLLREEAPVLQAMMHGEKEVPECLRVWLR